MKSLCESKLQVGDPDGTRKRPAHLSDHPATATAQQYQALGRQRSPQRAIKTQPVDKKTDKFPLKASKSWRGVSHLILALSLTGCAGYMQAGHTCPYIVPDEFVSRILAETPPQAASSRRMLEECPGLTYTMACSRWAWGESGIRAEIILYNEGLSESVREDAVFHEVCHLWEIGRGLAAPKESAGHSRWIVSGGAILQP